MKLKLLATALVLFALTGCTMAISTERHEIRPPSSGAERVLVDISDSNLGGGEQAYVNASIGAQIKGAMPSGTLVAGGEDLSLSVQLLQAHTLPRWYTIVTLGLLKQYYQLGSVRVVNQSSGEILAVHDVLLTGRRVFPLSLTEYQTLVLPQVVQLLKDEIARNGLAMGGRSFTVDVTDS